MTPSEQARWRAIDHLATIWPANWTRERKKAYVDALDGHEPGDVQDAVRDVVATWDGMYAPPPAVLIANANRHAERRHREHAARLAAAQRANQRDQHLIPSRINVLNRPCGRPACRGRATYLTGENILWCDTCRSAQTIEVTDGKVRVKLTAQERDLLEFEVMTDIPAPTPGAA